MDTLSIDQLQTFVTIAREGSFTKAAEKLYRTQPALSLQIKKLEEQLGAELFRRDGRESKPTEAGRMLMSYARRILELNDEVIGRLSVVKTAGIVRVGVLEEVTHGLLVGLLTRFGRLCSEIRIELEVSTSWELVKKVQRNELCLVVANNSYTTLPCTDLWTEKYFWAIGGDFSLTDRDVVPLIVDPIDTPCHGLHEALASLDSAGRKWDVAFSSHSLNATQAAVRAGLGVGMISGSALTSDMRIIGPDEGFPAIPDATISLYRGSDATSSAVDSLENFLISQFEDKRPKV
jgi:DNA-binding transcriptional LysR family regulator